MATVWSCNEWDQLEEVIVGNPLNARFPTPDLSTQLAEFPDRPLTEIPRGPFPQQIIEETEEDLNEFVQTLERLGVTVKRPETWPHDATFSTINWQSQGYYNYCPRDVMLVIGDHVVVFRREALQQHLSIVRRKLPAGHGSGFGHVQLTRQMEISSDCQASRPNPARNR